MKKTLFLRIFLGYAAVIILLAAAVTLFAPPLMRTHHIEEQAAGLEHIALLLEGPGPSLPRPGRGTGHLEDFVKDVGRRTATRITVIDADGKVLADSEKDPRDMENHLYRPEIQAALRGEKQMSIRPSSTLKTDMMYMSFPLRVGRQGHRGPPAEPVHDGPRGLLFDRSAATSSRSLGLVTLFALVVAFFLARSLPRPIREFIDASARVAAGDFDVTGLRRAGSGEFRDFALRFNAMTGGAQGRCSGEIRLQTEELNSILASIREGLCVLDARPGSSSATRVSAASPATRPAGGKYFWEVVRSSAAGRDHQEGPGAAARSAEEIAIGDRSYVCNVSPLAAGDRLVVTLHDITEFRALEKIKKDFVVNVSHELKTPLTAIKGFVETMEPRAEEENRPYLEIVRRNTDRLIAIVEDLLVLSQLEAPGMKLAKGACRCPPHRREHPQAVREAGRREGDLP